jgi:hypothetical protein
MDALSASQDFAIVIPSDAVTVAAEIANRHASAKLFADYRSRRAANTLRRQDAALSAFAYYLCSVRVSADPVPLVSEPAAWSGMTWGLVAGFARWLLQRGYAIGTGNGRLCAVKVYAQLAMQAGAIDRSEWIAIQAVKGYGHAEGRHIDEGRARVRVGHKKAEPVTLTEAQAVQLKRGQPDTPQGRRDALMLCLLLDHRYARGSGCAAGGRPRPGSGGDPLLPVKGGQGADAPADARYAARGEGLRRGRRCAGRGAAVTQPATRWRPGAGGLVDAEVVKASEGAGPPRLGRGCGRGRGAESARPAALLGDAGGEERDAD